MSAEVPDQRPLDPDDIYEPQAATVGRSAGWDPMTEEQRAEFRRKVTAAMVRITESYSPGYLRRKQAGSI